MATNLKTGWVTIATSGQTMDGREIKKEWLTDMAKSYDPSLYSSKLWPDHLRVFGSQGKVLALKTEPATTPGLEGEIQLKAIIAPSDELVAANKAGQFVHTSIEILKNFAGKGFTYLGGLGVTDTPASLGTTEMQFSEQADRFFITGAELDLSSVAEEKESFSFLNMFKPKPDEQENIMTPEQFAALLEAQKNTAAAISALGDKFAASQKPAETPTATTPATVTEPTKPEFVSVDKFSELQEKFTAIEAAFTELKNKPVGSTVPASEGSNAGELVL